MKDPESPLVGQLKAKSSGPGFFAQLSGKNGQKQATTYNNSVPVTRTKCVLSPVDSVVCEKVINLCQY
jgi:hypothetical protein